VHKIARVLDALPQSLQPKAKADLHEIMNAENKEAAETAMDRFHEKYGAKHQKATERLLKDREVLLTHFAYAAEHWVHPRSTNAIESTFATLRLRTNKTKGAGSRSAVLAMAYKLLRPTGAASTRPTSRQRWWPGGVPTEEVAEGCQLHGGRATMPVTGCRTPAWPRRPLEGRSDDVSS
jgi:transposase-like protein